MSEKTLEPGTVALETVQRLVSELEGADMRTLPQLPHRVILPGGEDALVRSDSGEHFYKLSNTSHGWQCSCKGYIHHRHCKHSTGIMNYLAREQAREERAASLLLKGSAMTEAQRFQAKRRAQIAAARAAPVMTDESMMSTAGFKPVVEA